MPEPTRMPQRFLFSLPKASESISRPAVLSAFLPTVHAAIAIAARRRSDRGDQSGPRTGNQGVLEAVIQTTRVLGVDEALVVKVLDLGGEPRGEVARIEPAAAARLGHGWPTRQ